MSGLAAQYLAPGADHEHLQITTLVRLIHQGQQIKQVVHFKSHTTVRWATVWPAHMNKDCTATPAHRRIVIVADNQHKVVHMVFPPQPFVAVATGQADRSVVTARGRVITPAIIRRDDLNGQSGFRASNPVGTIQDIAGRPDSGRRRPVAFPLHLPDAGGADTATEEQVASLCHRLVAVVRHMTYNHFMKIFVFS
jgi:hypothetical protein